MKDGLTDFRLVLCLLNQHVNLLSVFLPQNTHSNGQPVAVAQEEVKVVEVVSKQAPHIRTEKVYLRSCCLNEAETMMIGRQFYETVLLFK